MNDSDEIDNPEYVSDLQLVIANQVSRILKPGGTFSFIEASDPTDWQLRPLYRFYMNSCLPILN